MRFGAVLAVGLLLVGGCGEPGATAPEGKTGGGGGAAGGMGGKGGTSATPGAGGAMAGGMGGAGAGGSPAASNDPLVVPQLYPPIRAATPNGLIADPKFARLVGAAAAVVKAPVSLATVVRDRIYTPGPTELLRIVREIDDRIAGLDLRPAQHPCLTAAPVDKVYALPGGVRFPVRLQCLQGLGEQWLAFGFAAPLPAPAGSDAGADADSDGGQTDGGEADGSAGFGDGADAGAPEAGADAHDRDALAVEGGGDDFYLAQGMTGGMGSAYHVDRRTGNVEGWIVVADSRAPNNSQVIMHLRTDRAAGTLELSFGGSGVGFCAAHLKTQSGHIFIAGKTNAPPPPGSPMTGQYCDAARAGCFAATALETDLGADAPACTAIDADHFAIHPGLDASTDAAGNVTPAALTGHFNSAPTGVAAF